MFPPPTQFGRKALLSASSWALLVAMNATALAQDGTSAQPPAATPQPPAAAPASPTPQQNATPVPDQAAAPAPQSGAGNVLPELRVVAPVERPRRAPTARVVASRRPTARVAASTSAPAPTQAEVHVQAVTSQNQTFDTARQNIVAPAGATSSVISRQSIQALPQGDNASLDKVLLQLPGVTQDSAASGDLHVRNEHGNVQYRINGIQLPDGVGAFGQFLDTGIVGSLALLTGALPAQFGLHTAGVIDIQTRNDAFNNSGSIGVYGGSHGTITTTGEYGGTIGNTQYFVSGKFMQNNLGIESPTPDRDAIHDRTNQEKGFLYLSTLIDPTSRLTFMSGISNSTFQIPNNPGQTPAFNASGVTNFDSASLNEHQNEFNQFNVFAYQKAGDGIDYQVSYFNRYSQLHFMPDPIGDLVFNGVASDVYRQSFVNGLQEDTSWRVGYAHTLRFGFTASAERSMVTSITSAFPTDATGAQAFDAGGNPLNPNTIFDSSSKLGYLFGAYVQDEWRINNQLTLNYGLRFDQMWQYVDANQLSPRVSLTWKPADGTTFHAGYSRNFTPPDQVIAAPTNLALVQGTTQQPAVSQSDPVQPERSNVFDVGVVQKIYPVPGLEVGVDGYYKTAKNLLDDGQFGAAYVLSGFNYAYGDNVGVELKATYENGPLRLYGNIAWAKQTASNVVSNQYLFDPDELAYIASHDVYTDHAQILTGSAGASYLWNDTRYSVSMIYGSGLRAGFANTDHLPSYTQVNLGLSHDFYWVAKNKPTTFRFDVVNLFDSIYEIRDGSGIGVFAPQYGPRRGFYFGISQKI